jgi:hypothetical protein
MVEAADAGLKSDVLREMAKLAVGHYYEFSEADQLPPEIAKTMKEARFTGMKPVDNEIWDTPLAFGLIFGLMVVEWLVRRRSGLA